MIRKYYIKDFVEEFNYTGIILYISEYVNLEHLRSKLDEDYLSHLYKFDVVSNNRMFYIENCDLQIISSPTELLELVNNHGYKFKILHEDKKGFFIKSGVLQ